MDEHTEQSRSEAHRPARRRRAADDDPVLPRTPDEDRDEAWGDTPGRRGRDWYERERPPHHE